MDRQIATFTTKGARGVTLTLGRDTAGYYLSLEQPHQTDVSFDCVFLFEDQITEFWLSLQAAGNGLLVDKRTVPASGLDDQSAVTFEEAGEGAGVWIGQEGVISNEGLILLSVEEAEALALIVHACICLIKADR